MKNSWVVSMLIKKVISKIRNRKNIYFFLVIIFMTPAFSQVGINTTNPNAQLDIQSSNQAVPANTDGMLIPKIDTFPATSPTAAQQGMLVYLTTTVGSNPPGFYYWDNPTASWIPIKGNDTGSLDQAYDFGGAGLGRTITADAGAVTIVGNDGLVSTGTIGSGASAPNGAGTRMVWNPRKASFRAGNISGTEWDDANIGVFSVAFGQGTIASGNFSTAFGSFATASGSQSVSFGTSVVASGSLSTAFGAGTLASGSAATSFGNSTTASGTNSTAFGNNNIASGGGSTAFGILNIASGINTTTFGASNGASSYAETVIGIGATTYTPSTNGATQFRTANATDRLFVIGNAIDANSNNSIDLVERSDAIIVLKNGLTRLPSTTNTMIDAADGKAVVTKEYLQTSTSGTLDQAYDFGGAGLGRTITADAGAVTIAGTDGLVSTGTLNTGAVSPSGAGTRMVWNPRRAAFRAGNIQGTQWDEANIGLFSSAIGFNTIASGNSSVAFGASNTASGGASVAFGSGNQASGETSIASGNSNQASGNFSVAIGSVGVANGTRSISFGHNTISKSWGEIALGIGNTDYTPSINGATAFTIANQTDRLLVIGNAIDLNTNGVLDLVERRDALVILKNGNTGIGVSAPVERLQVAGRSLFTNGFSAENAALLYQNNTDYMFLGPQSGSSANGAAIALFGSTNASGGNAGGLDINVPNALVRMNHTNGNFTFGTNSTSGYTGAFELNDDGLEIGHNSAGRAILFNPNNIERMRLTPTGNLGVGTNNPAQKVHVSGPAGLTAIRIGNTSGVGASSNVALDFFRNTAANTDWRIYNIGPNLTLGNSGDDLVTVNDLYQFQGARFMPMTDATISLGQTANRWNTLFASNGTINTSDGREKKNIQNVNYGLNAILQLRPVSFEWKKDDGSGTKLGLIAQELQQVIPEVVRDWDWEEDEQGNRRKVASPILGVYYSDLIPVLIKATQEQQLVIEQQEEEIERLKQQLQEQYQALLERIKKIEEK